MVSRYELPLLDLSRRVQAESFTSAQTNVIGAGSPRSREEHGGKLRGEGRMRMTPIRLPFCRPDPIRIVNLWLRFVRPAPRRRKRRD